MGFRRRKARLSYGTCLVAPLVAPALSASGALGKVRAKLHQGTTMPDQPARGHTIDEVTVGMTATYERVVSIADIEAFAAVSGDHNPVHLDDAYAKTTLFKGRIAHGMLGASFISTVLASQLPGPGTVYLGQTLAFKAPVRPGDKLEARVTVTEVRREKKQVVLKTECRVGDRLVIDGEATVMVTQT
jgi:3-hydroxybutyryl-CoA dehydratase